MSGYDHWKCLQSDNIHLPTESMGLRSCWLLLLCMPSWDMHSLADSSKSWLSVLFRVAFGCYLKIHVLLYHLLKKMH